ncbi:unnamed protein product [Polarella glacialis]|uniref:Uncharacterized protein n=1 Tax=Polarella glacialis TaxID=89957 RepID=A0A813G5K9_POLGL|nr:unnamed protein product [Polarella glacialis]
MSCRRRKQTAGHEASHLLLESVEESVPVVQAVDEVFVQDVPCLFPSPERRERVYQAPRYDMYLISVRNLLKLRTLEPHQVLLRKGLLHKWRVEMSGRVIGISHQWLGNNHPDPQQEQLNCLQRLFRRILSDKIRDVKSHWFHQLKFGEGVKVSAATFRKALPHMFVWIDYLSIPQPSYLHEQEAEETQCADEAAKIFSDAVHSIHCYIERCTLLVVLVPNAMHIDTQHGCNFSTYRRRGWCRLEMFAALASLHKVHLLICKSAEAQPFFLLPTDALFMLPGTGDFTCCRLGHVVNGAPIPCDERHLSSVMETILDAKIGALHESADVLEFRYWCARRQHFLRNLPAASPEPKPSGLSDRLGWKDNDDFEGRKSGWTLLHYAVLADDLTEVRLRVDMDDVNASLVRGNPALHIHQGQTPLMTAMVFACVPVVAALVEARADPYALTSGRGSPGMTALHLAAELGSHEVVQGFLQHFPAFPVNQVCSNIGASPLIYAMFGPDKLNMAKVLAAARSDPSTLTDFGSNCLHAAAKKDDDDPELVIWLLRQGIPVNDQIYRGDLRQKSLSWRLTFAAARFLTRNGVQDGLLQEMDWWGSCTALHDIADSGNIEVARLLMAARADPLIKNAQGLTPLQLSAAFYGEVPKCLEESLECKVQ